MKPIYISDNDYFRWQYNGNEYVLHIQQDSDPEDPRTLYDHDTLMACFHPRYRLGDTIDQREPEAFWQGLVRKYVPEATRFSTRQTPNRMKFLTATPGRQRWDSLRQSYKLESLPILCRRPDHSPMPKPALPLLSLPAPLALRPWGYHHQLRRPRIPLQRPLGLRFGRLDYLRKAGRGRRRLAGKGLCPDAGRGGGVRPLLDG